MGLYGGSTPPKFEFLIPLGHWDTGDKRANTRYPNYSPKTRFQAKFNFSPRPPRTPLQSVVHHNVGMLIPFMTSKRPKKAYNSHFGGSPLQFSCICYYFSVIFNKKQDPNPKKQKKTFFLIFWTIFPIQKELFTVILRSLQATFGHLLLFMSETQLQTGGALTPDRTQPKKSKSTFWLLFSDNTSHPTEPCQTCVIILIFKSL